MSDFKNKTTVFIIVALVLICGGSFIGVKALNSNAKADVTSTQSTYKSTTVSTTASTSPSMVTEVISTSPSVSNLVGTPTGEAQSSASAVSTTKPAVPTTNAPATTTTNPYTTKQSVSTTAPASTMTTTASTSNPYATSATNPTEVIQNAAVFDDGFLSYQYDPDGNYYYTNSDPWQRQFGFNEAYDIAAPFVVMYYDTMRCKFEYGDKDWLIQFWKGQYGWVFIGHEIGVYTKPKDRQMNHYDCASNEDALYMSMTGYRKGQEIFSREYGKYWWCTGFVPGRLDSFQDRSELSLTCRITTKDYKMLLAFCGALQENGLVQGVNYTTNGLDVFIKW